MQLMTDHVCCLLCVCAVQPGPLKYVDTRPVPGPNKTLPHGLALPGHTNAQGDFARFARKLLPALLPQREVAHLPFLLPAPEPSLAAS